MRLYRCGWTRAIKSTIPFYDVRTPPYNMSCETTSKNLPTSITIFRMWALQSVIVRDVNSNDVCP